MFEQTKTCEICQEDFIPDGRRKKRCGKKHYKNCKKCGKSFLITSNMKPSIIFCSRSCSSKSRATPKKNRFCKICGKNINDLGINSTTCSIRCRKIAVEKAWKNKKNIKKCEICGDEFTATNSQSKYCKKQHYKNQVCKICGKEFKLKFDNKSVTCSKECLNKAINNPESNEKRRLKSQKKWGTDFSFQAEQVKNKIKETNRKKYSVDWGLSSQTIRDKGFKTSIEKYGHKWPRQHGKIKENAEKTNIDKYGVPNVFMSPEIQDKARKNFIKKYGDGFTPHPRISKINIHTAKLLENHFGKTVFFEQSLGNFYTDLKIEDLFIDIHPTISHNSYKSFICSIKNCSNPCLENHNPIAQDYHYKRALAALDNDVTLIQKYDWDSDENLLKLVDGKIGTNFKKYSARKLTCRKIPQKTANKFLNDNHIQSGAKSQTYCYGLFKTNVKNENDNENIVNDELLAVATFGKSRFNKNYEFEFIRYAVKSGIIIHGGSGKLFKEFINETKPSTVVSYVDFDHTTRKHTFLNTLGFVEDKPTGPAKSWFNVNKNKKVSQVSLVMQGADRLLGTNYGSVKECGLNNEQIMLREGYLPVYNSGNRVFAWKNL